jgi:hypothetical protein
LLEQNCVDVLYSLPPHLATIVLPEQKYVDGLYSFPPHLGLVEDELGGVGGVEEELGGGGGSALQLGTIVASPALTHSIQAERVICEQVPEFNLQETISLPPDELLEGSPPPDGESLEQAKKIDAMAKIADNERKFLVFIVTS